MYSSSCNKVISALAISVLAASAFAADSAADTAPGPDLDTGKAIYSQTCIACHGQNGKGAIPGVVDLTKADGPLAKSDDELVTSISEGLASPGAVLTMPANGGNPSLTEAEIRALIAYLREAFGS